MKTPYLVLTASLLMGCSSFGPEAEDIQTRYSERSLWQGALLRTSYPTDVYRCLDVEPGTNTIFQITDGYCRSQISTAHSSHDTVYLILPREPREGERVEFSRANGSLDFVGFGGYWYYLLDTNEPASATLEVLDISRLSVDVRLTVTLHYRIEDQGKDSPPHLLHLDEQASFRRRTPKRKK
jgi:hypothetical protein